MTDSKGLSLIWIVPHWILLSMGSVQSQSFEQLRELLHSLASRLVCWKVGIYYGAVVYFEMGEREPWYWKGNYAKDRGTITLSVEGYCWSIWDNQSEITNSSTVTREIAEAILAERFIGKRLNEVSIDQEMKLVTISFSGDLRIIIQAISGNDYTDDCLFNISLPDYSILYYDVNDGICLAPGESPRRPN